MNKITQEKVAMAVNSAIENENLMNKTAAACFGFSACYLSMIKRPNQYEHCPAKAWKVMQEWMYSGKPLKGYKVPVKEEGVSEGAKNFLKDRAEMNELEESVGSQMKGGGNVSIATPDTTKQRLKKQEERRSKKLLKPIFSRPGDPDYLNHIARAVEESPVPLLKSGSKILTPDLVQKIVLEVEIHLSIKQ